MLLILYNKALNLWYLQAFLPLVFPLFLRRLALFLWKKGLDSTKESESESKLNSPSELELFNSNK